jgi:alpha-L-arabinofuranosidase
MIDLITQRRMQADAIRTGEVGKLAPLWQEYTEDLAREIEHVTDAYRSGVEQFDRAVDEWQRFVAGAEGGET